MSGTLRTFRHSIIGVAACATVFAACTTGSGTASRRPARAAVAAGSYVADVSQAQPTPRQVVRTGDMRVEVESVAPARVRLEHAVAALGGEVARFEAHQNESADYALRVPPARLDALMDSAAALGSVKARTVSAEDVTAQVIDAEARLTALRASRDRLRQLLDRAGTVPDVVSVERELARVQGEVESLEGRLKALEGQVAMSQLAVRLDRKIVLGPVSALFAGIGRVVAKLFVL